MNQDEVISAQLVDDPQVDKRPVRWREIVAVLLLVALSDATIYRGHGFAGYALLLAGVPWLLLWGAPWGRRDAKSLFVVGLLIMVLVVKMVWCGSWPAVGSGLVLLLAFALAQSGLVPYVLEIVVFPSRMMLGGLLGLAHYSRSATGRPGWNLSHIGWLSVLLPLATCIAFSLLFVLANPELLASFGEGLEQLLTTVRGWLVTFSPDPGEVAFWVVMAWIAIGMLRPLLSRPLFEEFPSGAVPVKPGASLAPAPMYSACRNTLATVNVLFAVYLVFEFKTLWFREFPEGFYYSGYAHQGAAWLTVALALATAVLSLAFRETILRDPRLKLLRRLAWMWSILNVLLAAAVYHRLFIYIGFNGMTRMRIVGLLGISAVVVGFLLVLWKIAKERGFVWLLRRHLWTVALAAYFYTVLPVDVLVVQYNVRRILAGDVAPAVQFSVQPISAEGLLLLRPLLDCGDPIVREGVRTLLADEQEREEALAAKRKRQGWTTYQLADHLLRKQLRASADQWSEYKDLQKRRAVRKAFDEYTYQWY